MTQCKDCKYFEENENFGMKKMGLCHRFPPTGEDQCAVRFINWCGEFKQNKKDKKE